MYPADRHERVFKFAARIIKLCKYVEESGHVGRTLNRQLLRSATSIGANLEEASVGQSKADFIANCHMSPKEAYETRYWLKLFVEAELISQNRLDPLIQESNEIIAILTMTIKNAKASS